MSCGPTTHIARCSDLVCCVLDSGQKQVEALLNLTPGYVYLLLGSVTSNVEEAKATHITSFITKLVTFGFPPFVNLDKDNQQLENRINMTD